MTESVLTRTASGARPVAQDPETESVVRVVILGAGKMARHHATAISRVANARVVGFADPSPEARAAMSIVVPGAEALADPYRLVSEVRADVAHICTPPDSHAAAARAALDAGMHVYVEKPFAPTSEQARELLNLADERGLKMCAGHQLLFESPTLELLRLMPALRDLVHIESYFSFRPVRRMPDGRASLQSHLQLLDILPHPVYLLARLLETVEPNEEPELAGLEIGPAGTVHAIVRAGTRTANLVVTLEGRPVESYVRVVGTHGSLTADYVRGTVQRVIGPGTSGIDKILQPYAQSRQLVLGTTVALWRRVAARRRSYPGLREVIAAFYEAAREGRASPVSNRNILATTRLCENVAAAINRRWPAVEPVRRVSGAPRIAVTGGTGFLGSTLVRSLRDANQEVTVLSRRVPAPWERIEGVEYVTADLGTGLDPADLVGADVVIHCAAATSGGWDAHQRDSIDATRTLLTTAAAAGVSRVIHVSSLAVQTATGGRAPISEQTPLAADARARGPYAWGKHESETLALNLGRELGLDVKVVRPGALIDYDGFDPPGRLGRRIAGVFIAVGSPRDRLGTCNVAFAGSVLAWMASNWPAAPRILNLLDPQLPSKRELVARLRQSDPGISVVWLPRALLFPLSWAAMGLQKALRPRKPAINVARVYAPEAYATTGIQSLAARMHDRHLPDRDRDDVEARNPRGSE